MESSFCGDGPLPSRRPPALTGPSHTPFRTETFDARLSRAAPDVAQVCEPDPSDLGGDGAFAGYASVFGEVDLGKDVIERGAFRASLTERGAGGVRMLYQHDPNEPIGAWTLIREDERGLYVEGCCPAAWRAPARCLR